MCKNAVIYKIVYITIALAPACFSIFPNIGDNAEKKEKGKKIGLDKSGKALAGVLPVEMCPHILECAEKRWEIFRESQQIF